MPDTDPAGWIRVLGAPPAPGSVTEGRCDVVVWTTESGATCVVDSRCPHQWSSLASEGVVVGEELLCTAHGWRFDTAGRGTKLNALGRRDRKGDVETVAHRVGTDGAILVRRDEPTRGEETR